MSKLILIIWYIGKDNSKSCSNSGINTLALALYITFGNLALLGGIAEIVACSCLCSCFACCCNKKKNSSRKKKIDNQSDDESVNSEKSSKSDKNSDSDEKSDEKKN